MDTVGDRASTVFGFIVLLVLFAFGAWIYFIPSIAASRRKHNQLTAIICLNILAGWTFIGWVAAMVWAYIEPSNVKVASAEFESKTCPRCAESVKAAALVCRYCGHEFPEVPPPLSRASVEGLRALDEELIRSEPVDVGRGDERGRGPMF